MLKYCSMSRRKYHPLARANSLFRCGVVYLVVLVIAAPLFIVPSATEAAGPEKTAGEFVQQIQHGTLDKAKRLLETSGYRYPHPGGDAIYFVYESGYDPNLAFLVGHPFVVGTLTVRQQRSDWYLVDGTIYADVTFPLRFESYRPWVLPGPIAFGRRMEFIDFMNYVTAPGTDSDRLSLRIRPSIESGLIKAPAPRFVAPPPPLAPPRARAVTAPIERADTYGSLFGSHPVDPAPVLLPSGENLTLVQMSRFLPRLGAIRLNISLIRWGWFSSWKVVRWNFADAVLITEKGEVVMSVGSGGMRELR